MATPKVKKSTITPHFATNNALSKVSSFDKHGPERMPPWESPSMSKAWPNTTRKASTNHGDLSSIRPKSPPLMVFMAPNSGIRHVPRIDHFDNVNDLPLFPRTPSVKSRLHRRGRGPAKTPTYDPEADLSSCRTRSQREYLSTISGSPTPTRIVLTGLDCAFKSPLTLYKPKVQLPEAQFSLLIGDLRGLSSLRHCLPIEQLDNCTVWTQLSFETAEMLYEIDRIITCCVEGLLANKLTDLDMAVHKQTSIAYTTNGVISRNSYLLSFSVSELMEIALERMRLDYYRHTSMQSSEVLRELFLLYLLFCNNIDKKTVGENTYGTITLGPRPDGGLHDVQSPAHVVPRSDSLLFPCLDILPREGSTIEIRPRYHRGVFDERNDKYSPDVIYSIVDLPPWLHWDEKISGWTGQVPMYSELRGMTATGREVINGGRDGPYAVLHLLRLEVKGTLYVRHSSLSVGLKRTVRTRLTLKVIPWYAAKRAQNPLVPWQHESYSQNDSAAVDLKFQEYLARCQEALEPRSGEYLVSQKHDSRIMDVIDGNMIGRKGVYNAHKLTTNPGYGPPRDMDSGHRHDELLPPQPDHVNPFIIDEHSEPQRLQKIQESSEVGSAYELSHYPASDSGLSFKHLFGNPVQSHHGQKEWWSHKSESSCSETGEQSWSKDSCQTRDVQEKISAGYGSRPNNEPEDHIHWEENHDFETDVCNSGEHDERGDTLQYASPELYKMAQTLHEPEFQLNGAQRLDATQGEHCTPSKVSGSDEKPSAAPVGSEIEEQNDNGNVLLSETDDDKEDDTNSQSSSPRLMPYITCFINRFAPLRDLRADSSSSGSTSSSLLSDRTAVESDVVAPYNTGTDRVERSDENTGIVTVEDYHRFDSGCYMADNEDEIDDNINITDSLPQREPSIRQEDVMTQHTSRSVKLMGKSIQSGSGSSTSSVNHTQQMLSPQETPKLGPVSRQFSPMELLPCSALNLEPSPPYVKHSQRDTGLWQMESFDEIAADPSIRQQQALLWSVLANRESVDTTPKKDTKLETEELKGLWEVLKYEARQKHRNGVSEETLGVESGGENFASESEEETGTSSSGRVDEEMEDTWNFGC
ncbi:hypothetical protein MMC18_008235 [Xylographa bjoerkii]|nr:hypothetical protein [Xylographa bjoerkii]